MQRSKQGVLWGMMLLALLAHPVEVLAQVNLHDPSGSLTGLLDLIQQSASQWDDQLRGYAKALFWLLASIQFVWSFMPLIFRQADFGEIVGELLRFILVIGFFYALLLFSADWAGAVVGSFRNAGAHAAGLSETQIRPGELFGVAIELADTISDVETWNPLVAVMVAIAGLMVLLCFTFIAAFMGLTLIESYVVINASVLFMGFGGAQWTREYALAIARYAVAVGAKLFILTLIVGLIVDSAKAWQAAYKHDDASLWTVVGLALVCAYLAKTIPELVAGMISGTSMGGGSIIGGMAVAGAAGATAAIASLAAAPAVQGSSTNSSGRATESGGLAAALNASFSGAASNGSAPASGSERPSTDLDSRVAGAGPSMGSKADSKGPAASKSSESSPYVPKDSIAEPQKTEPTQDTASGPHVSGHQVASGLTRGVGILSAISVPGMEGAAGLSLGVEGQVPEPYSMDEDDSMATAAEPLNIIRPADGTPSKTEKQKTE